MYTAGKILPIILKFSLHIAAVSPQKYQLAGFFLQIQYYW
jgi:hypothetical protein